jgi:hypothetical protein
METTRKSKVDFPPALISESDMLSREFLQTRISIEVIAMGGSFAPFALRKFSIASGARRPRACKPKSRVADFLSLSTPRLAARKLLFVRANCAVFAPFSA